MEKFDAFVVRPFGKKNGVNFDEVQEMLIIPALKKAGAEGITTAAILKAGNIRQDMFQLLLTSDLVIADISIHNANVFYELGIRHALRAQKTLLIRSRKDEVPFDLKTDRYFAYDHEDPSASLDGLYQSIRATLLSEDSDSPVFLMLPALKPHDPKEFLAIPSDYSQEFELAARTGNKGKLRLLAFEAGYFSWALPAWRTIAMEQFHAGNFKDARESWEKIKKRSPKDIEAYEKLATIYQRLAEQEVSKNPDLGDELLARSEQAITFLFDNYANLSPALRAEAHALKARNEKWRWARCWEKADEKDLSKAALKSSLLTNAYENYLIGYDEDLNEFYPAINALALLKITLELAAREPGLWKSKYDSDGQAAKALEVYKKEFEGIAVVLHRTIANRTKKLQGIGLEDVWLDLTKAELALLTRNSPERVARLYQNALEAGLKKNKDFNMAASRRQVLLYEKLAIMPENVALVLEEYSKYPANRKPRDTFVILFTGHMIDAPGREHARFPEEKETLVRAKIKTKVEEILARIFKGVSPAKRHLTNVTGIAGGACGGDILFHEVCGELEIKREVYLALPHEKFVARSVRFAGNDWVDRFYALDKDPGTSFHILTESEELPNWLQAGPGDYSFWERNNLWILNAALALGGRNLTLLALWDSKEGDGPGGTGNMIKEVEKRGSKSIVISPD